MPFARMAWGLAAALLGLGPLHAEPFHWPSSLRTFGDGMTAVVTNARSHPPDLFLLQFNCYQGAYLVTVSSLDIKPLFDEGTPQVVRYRYDGGPWHPAGAYAPRPSLLLLTRPPLPRDIEGASRLVIEARTRTGATLTLEFPLEGGRLALGAIDGACATTGLG